MMRLVVLGMVGFLLSLGGTTGALVMRSKAATQAAADSVKLHPDSTSHDSSRAQQPAGAARRQAGRASDAAQPQPAPAPTRAGPAAAAGLVDSSPRSGEPAPAVAQPLPDGLHATTVGGQAAAVRGGADLSFRQLARIFSNMKTTDAVKVMAYMSDDEVQGVLEELGVRQAAGLLAAFPKERAAALSRRLLHVPPKPAGGK
jgi:hypothetical protein